MPTTDYKFPTAFANVDNGGQTWRNETRAGSDNDSYADVDTIPTGSDYLALTTFDFSEIPATAIIMGIEAEIDIKASNNTSTGTQTYYLAITENGSTFDTANKKTGTYAVTASDLSDSSAEIDSFGAGNDRWGQSLTGASLTTTFGVGVWGEASASAGSDFAVDYLKMRLTWEYPGGGMIGDI